MRPHVWRAAAYEGLQCTSVSRWYDQNVAFAAYGSVQTCRFPHQQSPLVAGEGALRASGFGLQFWYLVTFVQIC
jgi:hypothetical protein